MANKGFLNTFLGLLVLFFLIFSSAVPGYSEGLISRIEIVSIDSSQFPEITLQARILDSVGLPLEQITPEMIRLNENGQPVDFTYRSVDKGSLVAFVIDCGAGIMMRGGSGDTRLNEIKTTIEQYLTGMGPNDEALIIQQVGLETIVVQQLTNDRDKLNKALDAMVIPEQLALSYGLNGIQKALDDLKGAARTPISKSVLFFSSGVQTSVASISSGTVINFGKELGFPIHTVMVRESLSDVEGLVATMQNLSNSTGGMPLYYQAKTDVDKLYQWYDRQRIQYAFNYRSKITGNSDRTVDLTVPEGGSQAPRGSAKYTVNLAAPRVVIEQPVGGQQYFRESPTFDTDLNSVEPTSTSVVAHIEWPDGFARRIASAELLIDNSVVGTPLVEPGDTLTFNWDLRSYTTPGENNAQVRIRVMDELGTETLSLPITVGVVIRIPPPPPPPGECDELSGAQLLMCRSNNFTGWLGLALILPTLALAVLAYRKRDVIVEGSKGMVGLADQAWKRLTGGKRDMVAAAYLQVLSEAHKPILSSSIPLYKGEPHTIGRDPTTNRIPVLETRLDTVISREHCEISEREGTWFIKDVGSTYGTFRECVQLQAMTEEVLHDGDELWLGPLSYGGLRLLFCVAASDGTIPEAVQKNRETH